MKRISLIGTAVTVLACVPLRRAFAYIDPNSAGALYQFLFPVLIAIGSVLAGMRRVIRQSFARLAAFVRRLLHGSSSSEAPAPPPGRHAR